MLDVIERVDGRDLKLRVPPYAEFDAEEFARRCARLRALMELEGIDAALLTQEENVRYFTGYLTVLWGSKFRPLVAIIPRDPKIEACLVVSHQEVENGRETSWVPATVPFPAQEPPIPFIVRELAGRGLDKGRIGMELGFGQRLGMNQQQLHDLQKQLPKANLVDVTPLAQTVRMLKSSEEIDRLARASAISEAGVRAGWEALREGQTERAIVTNMAVRMYEAGAEVGTKPTFLGILAGDRWRMANAVPSNYRIKPGDLILIDGGATYRGYTCDFIRQASVGPLTDAQARWFDAVIDATRAAVEAVRPGVPAHRVYETALEVLRERGVVEGSRMNIIGHGIGMDIHELPWIGEADSVYTSDITIREGMTLCIEPGVKAWNEDGPSGHFIVEDVIAVGPRGAKLLTGSLSREVWCSPVEVASTVPGGSR